MIIRNFTPNDLKRVYDIECMSFSQKYDINIFQQLYNMGIGFFVAEKDDYVVGYIMFWIKYEHYGHIISIAVDKNYRKQGVGKKLLSKAISVLSLMDIDSINLEVRQSNIPAIKFYEKFNFIKDRTVPKYYDDGDGAILMYLPLKR